MCLFGAKGPLMKTENNLLHYKISTNHGQSGGPIFIKTIQNKFEMIGIHTAAGNNYNQGKLLTLDVKHQINKWLDFMESTLKLSINIIL